MSEYAENGLKLGWDPAEAAEAVAGRPLRLAVTGWPAHASNAMRVLYAVDGGPERIAPAHRAAPLVPGGLERFVADLPPMSAGSTVAWRPVLSCAGREADPRRGGVAPARVRVVQKEAPVARPPATAAARRFPYELDYLARVTAPLAERPQVVGETPEGLQIVFPLGAGGTVEGPRLSGSIEHAGGDWMSVRRDGIGISDIRVLVRTGGGDLVKGEYGGVVDFGKDGYAQLAAGGGPERAEVQLAPRYLTASPRLAWLNRLQCVGIGRVTMSTLLVEYDLYAVESHAADLD